MNGEASIDPGAVTEGLQTTPNLDTAEDRIITNPLDLEHTTLHIPAHPSGDTEGTPADVADTVTETPSSQETTTLDTTPNNSPQSQEHEQESTYTQTIKKEIDELGEIINGILTKNAVAEIGTPPSKEKMAAASEATRALWELDAISKGKVGFKYETANTPALQITKDGQTYQIVSLDNFDPITKTYTFTEKRARGTFPGTNVGITAQDIYNARLATNKNVILAGITNPHQRKIMELYLTPDLDSALPKEGTAESNTIDQTIREAGKESFIPTVDDLSAFAENMGLSAEEKDELLSVANGNLLDYKPFEQALKRSDISPEKLQAEIVKMENGISQIDLLKEHTLEQKAAMKKAIEQRIHQYKQFKYMYGGGLETFFNQIKTGQLPPEQAKAFLESFRSANISEAFEQLPGFEKQEGESDEAWKMRMKKQLGIAGLVALILVMASAQTIQSLGSTGGPQH